MGCIRVKDFSKTKEKCRDSCLKELSATTGVINLWLNGQYSHRSWPINIFQVAFVHAAPSTRFCFFRIFSLYSQPRLKILATYETQQVPPEWSPKFLPAELFCYTTRIHPCVDVWLLKKELQFFTWHEWQAQRPIRIEEQRIKAHNLNVNKMFWKSNKIRSNIKQQ